MNAAVRILTAVFWVAAPIFVLSVMFSTRSDALLLRLVGTLALAVVVVCSGFILWTEWRANPIEQSERGEWTGKQLFYAIIFTVTFFLSFFYLPALYFSF